MELLMFLLLTSCANSLPIYTEKVVSDCHTYNCKKEQAIKDTKISFGDIPSKYMAICQNGKIQINSDYWFILTQNEKELLLLHEYGHCIFNKKDINDIEVSDIMVQRLKYTSDHWDDNKELMLKKYFSEVN